MSFPIPGVTPQRRQGEWLPASTGGGGGAAGREQAQGGVCRGRGKPTGGAAENPRGVRRLSLSWPLTLTVPSTLPTSPLLWAGELGEPGVSQRPSARSQDPGGAPQTCWNRWDGAAHLPPAPSPPPALGLPVRGEARWEEFHQLPGQNRVLSRPSSPAAPLGTLAEQRGLGEGTVQPLQHSQRCSRVWGRGDSGSGPPG